MPGRSAYYRGAHLNPIQHKSSPLIGRNNIELALAYWTLTLVYGVIFLCADQRPSRNDEGAHWARAMQILSGHIKPVASATVEGRFGAVSDDGRFRDFSNTSVYNPVVYLPSLLSGRNYFAACILTLICSVTITSVAILLSREMSALIAVSALLPTVFLSYLYPSADSLTTAFAFLFFAVIWYVRGKDGVSFLDVTALAMSALVLGCAKPTTLALLVLLPLAISSNRRLVTEWLKLLPAVVCALVPAVAWEGVVSSVAPGVKSLEEMADTRNTLLANPSSMLLTLWKTLINPLDNSVEPHENIARNIQLLNGSEFTVLPMSTMVPILLVFVLVAVRTIQKLDIDGIDRTFAVLTCAAVYVLTTLAMIMTWKGQPGGYAEGMQSRYFTILMPIVPLVFPPVVKITAGGKRFFRLCIVLVLITYVGMFFAHVA